MQLRVLLVFEISPGLPGGGVAQAWGNPFFLFFFFFIVLIWFPADCFVWGLECNQASWFPYSYETHCRSSPSLPLWVLFRWETRYYLFGWGCEIKKNWIRFATGALSVCIVSRNRLSKIVLSEALSVCIVSSRSRPSKVVVLPKQYVRALLLPTPSTLWGSCLDGKQDIISLDGGAKI